MLCLQLCLQFHFLFLLPRLPRDTKSVFHCLPCLGLVKDPITSPQLWKMLPCGLCWDTLHCCLTSLWEKPPNAAPWQQDIPWWSRHLLLFATAAFVPCQMTMLTNLIKSSKAVTAQTVAFSYVKPVKHDTEMVRKVIVWGSLHIKTFLFLPALRKIDTEYLALHTDVGTPQIRLWLLWHSLKTIEPQ